MQVPGTQTPRSPAEEKIEVDPTFFAMAVAQLHAEGRLVVADAAPARSKNLDAQGNPQAFQGERLLYTDPKEEGETVDGPMNLTPKAIKDPKAVGWKTYMKNK